MCGVFINAVVQFTIIAFVLFLVVKGINSMTKQVAAETTPAAETKTAPAKKKAAKKAAKR